jgi:hypothetical protein
VDCRIEPNTAYHTALTDGQCKVEHLNHSQKLFDEILKKGLRSDMQARNSNRKG